MRGLDVVGFQITLDGMREFHDKVRVAPNKSSFDEILKRYSSFDEYFEKEYAIDKEVKENLIKKYCHEK